MKRINFLTNDKIEFTIEDGNKCTSLIQEVGHDYFLVTMPAVGFQWRLLNVGDTVECIYYSDNGNVYMFSSKILDRVVENIPLYKIRPPDSYKKIQRRDFVRVPIYMPVLYTKATGKVKEIKRMLRECTPDEVKVYYEGSWQRGSTLDLSGGGMKLSTKTPLEPDTSLIIIIKSDELHIAVMGRVVRCIKHVTTKVNYHCGIKFIDIDEALQDKIIGHIFEKLREMSKKEM